MSSEQTVVRRDLLQVMSVLIDEHYPSSSQSLGDASLYSADLAAGLADELIGRIDAWSRARDTGAGTLADCVLLMLPRLHRALCSRRSRRECCETDMRFAASMTVIMASWLIETPMVQPPLGLISEVMRIDDRAVRRDRLEVAFRDVLAPPHAVRKLPTIEHDRWNVQINTAITRPGNDAYFARRSTAKALEQALTVDGRAVEVTSDWAHPAARDRAPLDEAVDGAIYRTTAMIVFSDDGAIGTGDTIRLAASLALPTLVLRRPSATPLQGRRDGRLALRRVRVYVSDEDALTHAREFLEGYGAQIAARHANLLDWSTQAHELAWIARAVEGLDSAIFETARVTRDAATFFASDPVYWYQAGHPIRQEVLRLVSPGRLASQQSIAKRLPGAPGADGADAAVHRERISMRNLLAAAEVYGWSYAVVSRLLQENGRREARQTQTTSHVITPRQENDWLQLHREVYGR